MVVIVVVVEMKQEHRGLRVDRGHGIPWFPMPRFWIVDCGLVCIGQATHSLQCHCSHAIDRGVIHARPLRCAWVGSSVADLDVGRFGKMKRQAERSDPISKHDRLAILIGSVLFRWRR